MTKAEFKSQYRLARINKDRQMAKTAGTTALLNRDLAALKLVAVNGIYSWLLADGTTGQRINKKDRTVEFFGRPTKVFNY